MLTNQSNNINDIVRDISNKTNYYYPLSNFIASNYLSGYEKIDFFETMYEINYKDGYNGFLSSSKYRELYESNRINANNLKQAFEEHQDKNIKIKYDTTFNFAQIIDKNYNFNLNHKINLETIKWLNAYFDNYQSQLKMPRNDGGLFATFIDLIQFDLKINFKFSKIYKNVLASIKNIDSIKAIDYFLNSFEISNRYDYIENQLHQLRGWTAYLKYLDKDNQKNYLFDFLAIRLFFENLYVSKYIQDNKLNFKEEIHRYCDNNFASHTQDVKDYKHVWQEAYEYNYRDVLLSKIEPKHDKSHNVSYDFQAVFCIDTRSEPLRRNIEKIANCQTFGFAGFFGFAFEYIFASKNCSTNMCPVIINPNKKVFEVLDPKITEYHDFRAFLNYLRKKLKTKLSTTFGLVEYFGVFSIIPLILKTFMPKLFTNFSLSSNSSNFPSDVDINDFSQEEKLILAKNALNGIGLTNNFAKFVFICGHSSESFNNPYASSLDCGACGANGGQINARVACLVLNDKNIRLGLANEYQIVIPDTTIFVPALHNTCTDKFEILLSKKSAEMIDIEKKFNIALNSVTREKSHYLTNCSSSDHFRHMDWAQIQPELGLVNNASFIIADRNLTKDIDLNARSFLHSYDYARDQNAQILELIMTAPMVVGFMINMQYYLSAVDNNNFGSKSKTVHNVLGDFGVMSGRISDIKLGLPIESLSNLENQFMHEPMRLQVVIRAPLERIKNIILKHENLKNLVHNSWIKIIALNPLDNKFYAYRVNSNQKIDDSWSEINYNFKMELNKTESEILNIT